MLVGDSVLTGPSWTIAIPTMVATLVILMSNMIYQWLTMLNQRRSVLSWRKDRARRKARDTASSGGVYHNMR